ncbi:hypothetical protein [Hyphomicrobium sp.]|uniref:hypothetical protein n=1 Tax=Hyphomicrobium sp. TaxID=82 RepID=UPI002E35F5F9|nr:hypothetical protein [Hyphomicrobium sp.]HEX2842691.1 hypothetical protein [Hyphomicrobium sp.]
MTMQMHVLYLTIAYAALATVLLIVLARVALPRAVKIAIIAVMGVFNVAVFFWSQSLLGWSAGTAMPERFQVLWTRVLEPNVSKQFPGAIHLWVEELDERNIPSGEPRAYVVPYSVALARKTAEAQSEIKKGNAQGGKAGAVDLPPNVESSATEGITGVNIRTVSQGAVPGGDPSGGGVLDPSSLGGQSKSIDLIPLPKPLLPPKDLPEF